LASDKRARLRRIGGNIITFPYTPIINYQHQVEYSQYELIHTNYAIQSFVKSRPGNIQINAPFHHQTSDEARNTIGVISFLKTNTKMDFGGNGTGTPPPLLEFSAYGPINFENVPVFLGSFSIVYPDDVDYITISNEKLPVSMTINIDLIPHYSPKKQEQFSLSDFSDGKLYQKGYL
jgi:hypothetical protein